MSASHPGSPTARDGEGVCADARGGCADARLAREVIEGSHETLRAIRRELVDAGRLVEAAARDADPHGVADRKVALAAAWRKAMDATTTDAARQDATATWMRLISDTKERTRLALRELGRGRQHAARLEARLKTAELEAAAMRIRVETAEAACDEARRVRAAADERQMGIDGADRVVAADGSRLVGSMNGDPPVSDGRTTAVRAADGGDGPATAGGRPSDPPSAGRGARGDVRPGRGALPAAPGRAGGRADGGRRGTRASSRSTTTTPCGGSSTPMRPASWCAACGTWGSGWTSTRAGSAVGHPPPPTSHPPWGSRATTCGRCGASRPRRSCATCP